MENTNPDKHISLLANKPLNTRRIILIGIILFMITVGVYWQVGRHGFVIYDDPVYVTNNSKVLNGLSTEGIFWAFTTAYSANWHPLTWLSLMLDGQLFQNNPGGYHITNLLFHLANTLLLFGIFVRLTRALWCSVFVAVLFALHPLHVESVAWIAERKDVLSTFFGLLTVWAYVSYARQPSLKKYLLFFVLLGFSLLAKPMLVTLPFVLLLLDYWPLNRTNSLICNSQDEKEQKHNKTNGTVFGTLVWEKLPLLIPVIASCVLTIIAQSRSDTVKSLQEFDIPLRIANALVSYVLYIGKMFWPVRLAVIYPHPTSIPWWQWTAALTLLVSISVLVLGPFRHRRYLLVGWLWYLGTLVPVIGLLQVGDQALADRYTYVPLIGLFIMLSWGIVDLRKKIPCHKLVIVVLGVLVIAALSFCTWYQLGHWRNSNSLFSHTLAVTENNYIAHNNLGVLLKQESKELEKQGKISEKKQKIDQAVQHWKKALQIYPMYLYALDNLSTTLLFQNQPDEAIIYARRYLEQNPHDDRMKKILENAKKQIRIVR